MHALNSMKSAAAVNAAATEVENSTSNQTITAAVVVEEDHLQLVRVGERVGRRNKYCGSTVKAES